MIVSEHPFFRIAHEFLMVRAKRKSTSTLGVQERDFECIRPACGGESICQAKTVRRIGKPILKQDADIPPGAKITFGKRYQQQYLYAPFRFLYASGDSGPPLVW